MTVVSILRNKISVTLFVHILISMFLTGFLLYIDEGACNFKWMKHWQYWIFFLFMVSCFVAGQTFADKVLFRKFDENGKLIVTNIFGLPIGFLIYLAIISTVGYIIFISDNSSL